MKTDLVNQVAANFKIDGKVIRHRPFGAGHVHDTYVLETNGREKVRYLLQKINHHIFKDVSQLMRNIERVTSHIESRTKKHSGTQPAPECLTVIKTGSGELFFQDQQDGYWRMYVYIEGAQSFDVVETPELAHEGGKEYGKFLAQVSDLPGDELFETIPNFHNMERRLTAFSKTLDEDRAGRVAHLQYEIGFLKDRAEEMLTLHKLESAGKIRRRVTHNDTKFNNILFDSAGKVLCVVDLDTVMPGLVHYDFGDAIRTVANTAREDESDLDKISLNIELFDAFTGGFLEEAASFLNAAEIRTLAFSAKYMTFIMCLRFLTDYIDGDNYYKIHFDTHNLQRARAQFRLLESMEAHMDMMEGIVDRFAEMFVV